MKAPSNGRGGGLARRIDPGGRERARTVMDAWRRLPSEVGPDATTVSEWSDSMWWPGASEAAWYRSEDERQSTTREILTVSDLSIRFGGVHALDAVHCTARTGEVTGVIGPNGAGKSTVFNCLSGLLTPDAGTVVFDGRPLRGAPAVRARRGLGRTFQAPRLFPSLSIGDNLLFGCETADWAGHRYVFDPRLGRLPHRERAERIARLVGYRGDLGAPAGSLAFGDQRTVELARALCGAPTLLMLDEPASGLDTGQTLAFVALLRRLAEMSLAILLIEHDMHVVMGLCAQITVLDFGQVIATGSPMEIQRNQAVISAYLGKSSAHG